MLACGAGETTTAIAKRMGLTGLTVGKWRKRYRDLGLEGLHDELRPGRPRTYEDDKVAEVINRALQSKPTDGSTQWTARRMLWPRRLGYRVHAPNSRTPGWSISTPISPRLVQGAELQGLNPVFGVTSIAAAGLLFAISLVT